MLDISRKSFLQNVEDIYALAEEYSLRFNINKVKVVYTTSRGYHLTIPSPNNNTTNTTNNNTPTNTNTSDDEEDEVSIGDELFFSDENTSIRKIKLSCMSSSINTNNNNKTNSRKLKSKKSKTDIKINNSNMKNQPMRIISMTTLALKSDNVLFLLFLINSCFDWS